MLRPGIGRNAVQWVFYFSKIKAYLLFTAKGVVVHHVHTCIHVLMRRKKERSKQGQTNNKAKQHSTPKAVTFPKNIYIWTERKEWECIHNALACRSTCTEFTCVYVYRYIICTCTCTGVHNVHVYMCECFCCLSGLDVCTDITLDRKKWEDLFEQIRFFSLYK